jgi:RimJ/RimL family protein N-acetyltransferase
LQEAGAAHWVGKAETVSLEGIANASAALIEDTAARQAMRAAALTITDGLGANRTVSAIKSPVKAKDGSCVSLRLARPEHRDVMLAWQTAPGGRRYARNPQPPAREEHEQWFRTKLADPKCIFNVVMRNDEPVGILRYDWRDGEQAFEVSILIAAEWQGLGIAAAALTLGRRLLPDSLIVADVDPANVASAALFEGAAFHRMDGRKYILSPLNASSAHDGLVMPVADSN